MKNEAIDKIPDVAICSVCGNPASVGGLTHDDLVARWPSDNEIEKMAIHCCGSILTISDDRSAMELKRQLLEFHRDYDVF